MSDPDDSTPFTHRPYGSHDDDNPFTSPSGPASENSGPSYTTPPASPPPQASPYVPYGDLPASPPGTPPGAPPGTPPGFPPGWMPTYGAPLAGSAPHPRATTSMVLGIIGLASLLLTPFCCITLPGLLCSPFAWVLGLRARKEIDEQPGHYGNRAQAQSGFVMGVIGTVLGFLMVAGVAAFAIWVGVTDWSLV